MLTHADVLGAPEVRVSAAAKQQGASEAAATALPSGAEATALPSGAPHTLAARQQGSGARETEVSRETGVSRETEFSTALPSRAETGSCVRCSFYFLYWSERERGLDGPALSPRRQVHACVRYSFYLLY